MDGKSDLQSALWLGYFADVTVDKVTETKLADYVDRRPSQPRPAKPRSIIAMSRIKSDFSAI